MKKELLKDLENCITTVHNNIVEKVTPDVILYDREKFEEICKSEWAKFNPLNTEILKKLTSLEITRDELNTVMNRCDTIFKDKLSKKVSNYSSKNCYTD